ncbi:hypothetical protein DVH05_017989 [Phytophthora capsici]|nr:hypothetical protein DVH05_017989 [Phytophthora capsici]
MEMVVMRRACVEFSPNAVTALLNFGYAWVVVKPENASKRRKSALLVAEYFA